RPRGFLALGLQCPGKHGHEGGVERAFGKEPPEEIGEAERGLEGVGGRADAEHGGDQRVADKAEDAAHQRQPAHRERVAEEVHAAPCLRSASSSNTAVSVSWMRFWRVLEAIFPPVRSVSE